jgi:hypothetical protein
MKYNGAGKEYQQRMINGCQSIRDMVCNTYGAWSLATTSVPTDSKLTLLAQAVGMQVMPQFTGQVNIVCPQSRSYLRILDIPGWYSTGVETTVVQVEGVLWASPMHHLFQLAGPIRLVNNSPSSDMKTIYLKVWDSKAGSAVKELIGRTIQFGKYACCIVEGEAVPGTPLCQRCWCWGHLFKICRAQVVRCALCSEKHHEEHHHSMGSCCKAKPKATPPIAATPASDPCPHLACCPTCRGAHPAYAKTCPFWKHCFQREWSTTGK